MGERHYLGYYQDPLVAARVIMALMPGYYFPEELERIRADIRKLRRPSSETSIFSYLIGRKIA